MYLDSESFEKLLSMISMLLILFDKVAEVQPAYLPEKEFLLGIFIERNIKEHLCKEHLKMAAPIFPCVSCFRLDTDVLNSSKERQSALLCLLLSRHEYTLM